MRRLGILGGSFDPVHLGHVLLARQAAAAWDLDRVLLMPARDPFHKELQASAADRLCMAELAAREDACLAACTLELELTGKGYAADVLQVLKDREPEAELFYLIGADVLASLPGWYRSRELLSMATLLCAARAGEDLNRAREQAEALGGRVYVLEGALPAISSTEVRRRIARGEPAEDLLPPAVWQYIQKRNLYRQGEL